MRQLVVNSRSKHTLTFIWVTDLNKFLALHVSVLVDAIIFLLYSIFLLRSDMSATREYTPN